MAPLTVYDRDQVEVDGEVAVVGYEVQLDDGGLVDVQGHRRRPLVVADPQFLELAIAGRLDRGDHEATRVGAHLSSFLMRSTGSRPVVGR
jgi:hypothetical protein